MNPPFIHLRLHSEFSITDGIVRLKEAVKRAVSEGMPALALTDLSNFFGIVKFYKLCRGEGIKPIIGADVWVDSEDEPDHPFRMLLLCKNHAGYLQLCEWLTQAHLKHHHHGKARLQRAWFKTGDCSGLLLLSGAAEGEIGRALIKERLDLATKAATEWAALFPEAFYLEIQRDGSQSVENWVQKTLNLAENLDLPVVATHPIQFLDPEDFKAHEARVCIAEGTLMGDPKRVSRFSADQFFQSVETMVSRFQDVPSALENSVEIAKRCNVEISLGQNFLPQFPIPDGMTEEDYLRQEAKQGLEIRLVELFPDPLVRESQRATYEARLHLETETIISMQFPGYFLIVADFINWAKKNGVPVGPGRGSGAGSLVAFSLGITDIDPLAYALLFERFLNPERVSMPDFDIDFCQDKRYDVIEYVRRAYGAEAVSQIATFGTLASKAVVRDVGRVLEMPYSVCDQLSKLIPAAPGKRYSLADALEMEPQLQDRLQEEEVAELWGLAEKLEGLTRNIGMHAGGVLIAPGKLTDFCPLYQAEAAGSVPVSQLDKDDVEQIGLVKFDFLGLRNLTIIDWAVRFIKWLDPSFDLDLNRLEFTDSKAYEVLQKANTTAVFQLESDGMKRLLEKLKPTRFEDIIAVLALYRPGPLGSGMVDDFVLRKNGQQAIDYFHPDLQTCLDPTYGVIVYQEQVMQISQIIGGYTLGGADMLRRAMGKKKPEEMAKHRAIFVEGAIKKGYEATLAEKLFDLMALFAEYGFNKSHTAAYAVVAYQTAWLKAHHTAAFMAATLSSELNDTDQIKVFYEDTVKNGIKILPPDIQSSAYRFEPVDRSAIRYGLGGIKGTGEAAIESLIAARTAAGPFKDLFDLCRRTDKRIVNKRVLEALIRAGAMDGWGVSRATLMANVQRALDVAEQESANAHQVGLFEEAPQAVEDVTLEHAPDWDVLTQLKEEKLAIGFYLSGHPFSAYEKEIRQKISLSFAHLSARKDLQWIAGIISSIESKMGRRGKMMFVSLDDGTQRLELPIYSELLEKARPFLKEDQLLIAHVKISEDTFNGGGLRLNVDEVDDLAGFRTRFAHAICLKMEAQHASAEVLKTWLAPYADSEQCLVKIAYQNQSASCWVQLGDRWRVRPSDALLSFLKHQLGEERVQILY